MATVKAEFEAHPAPIGQDRVLQVAQDSVRVGRSGGATRHNVGSSTSERKAEIVRGKKIWKPLRGHDLLLGVA